MKFIVVGTIEITKECARALLESDVTLCALITLKKDLLPNNSVDIVAFGKNINIPVHTVTDINGAESISIIKKYNPDYIIGSWPRLFKEELIGLPKFECIGMHCTDLPYNRGRHALHWLISLGIAETALSFFNIDKDVDTGNILHKEFIPIEADENVLALMAKVDKAGYDGTKALTQKLVERSGYQGEIQDHSKANYWRKRSMHDVIIDLRMSANMIMRTIQSFVPPYPGSKLIFKDYVITIVNVSIPDTGLTRTEVSRVEHGKILRVNRHSIQVKAGDYIIELESLEDVSRMFKAGKYIHPPSRYMMEHSETLRHKLSL